MNHVNQGKQVRNSAIELLKIVAIIGIVLGHISGGIAFPTVINGVKLDEATWNFSHIVMQLATFLGQIGNNIFWICSCWFLVGDNRMSKRKLFGIVLDTWLISVIILCLCLYDLGSCIEKEHIKRSLLPTLFDNNWFITCYILMYAVHPFLNMVIDKLSQRGLFRTAITFALLYIVISAFTPGHFFPTMTIIWTAIYFIVAYIKLYLDKPSKNIRFNCWCIIISWAALTSSVVGLNYLETHQGIHLTSVLLWNSNQNPFVILMALSIFNLVRNYKFENKAINYLAGLTLFIYLFHENILLRTYYRPQVWNAIYELDQYKHLIFESIIFSLIVFIGSIIVSICYKELIRKPLTKILDTCYDKIKYTYLKLENKALKLNENFDEGQVTAINDNKS